MEKAGRAWLAEMRRYGAAILRDHMDMLDMLPNVETGDAHI